MRIQFYYVNATILCMHALEKNGNTIAKDLPAVSAAFLFDTPMYKFDTMFKVDRLESQLIHRSLSLILLSRQTNISCLSVALKGLKDSRVSDERVESIELN